MKKFITTNLSLKILSVVVAFLFWLVIVNLTDPMIKKTFYDIPVEIINENVITSVNQVYEVTEGDTVNVSVKGKRSFVEKLTKDDFSASADMSSLSKVNAVAIRVELKQSAAANTTGSYELDCGNAMLKVKLEKRVTKKFKVEVSHTGNLSENYVLGDMVAKPNIVEVSCGESKFKKIDHVGVVVKLNGQSDDFEATYSPLLYDSDGEVMDDTNVAFSNDKILVATKVLASKKVKINVTTQGTPAKGYRVVQTDYKPETIWICGSTDALENASSTIDISLNVQDARHDVEKDVEIAPYLSDGVSVVGDVTNIAVHCQIEKNGLRTLTFTPSDIAVKNLPADCSMIFAADSDKYQIVLRGDEANLKKVTVSALGAYVDLQGCSVGTHTMYVQFNLPDGVIMENTVRVKVILKAQGDDGQSITAESTPDTEEDERTETPDADSETTPEADGE